MTAIGCDMADWARCSSKQATLVICACNLMMVVCISQYLLLSYYVPAMELPSMFTRQADDALLPITLDAQERLNLVREVIQARLAAKPVLLIKRVKEIEAEALSAVVIGSDKTSQRQQRLDDLRKGKLKFAQSREAALLETERTSRIKDNVAAEEELMPDEVVNVLDQSESSGKVQEEPEFEDGIIPGRPVPEICHVEAHTDYGGNAVRWGLTHHVESAADCCEACLKQARAAKSNENKCNVWVFCPAERGCYSPDIYEHKHQECWLKHADEPKLNFKGHFDEEYRQEHPTAPVVVPWVSGIIQA